MEVILHRKTLNQLADNPIFIINKKISAVEKQVDETIKELISKRSNFSIESFNIEFDDESTPGVTLKCTYLEYDQDYENGKILDTFKTKKFEYCFSYEIFEFEDLALLLINKVECVVFDTD